MSITRVNDLKDATASANGLENAAVIVPEKFQQAKELLQGMNVELSSVVEIIDDKKTDKDRKQTLLWYLRSTHWYWSYMHGRTPKVNHFYGVETFNGTFGEGSHKRRVQPTMSEQDELIQNLRYKLLHESNCLAEEKKLIKQIKEAEEIRDTQVSDHKPDHVHYAKVKETNPIEAYREKMKQKKYELKVEKDIKTVRKELRSFQEARSRIHEKRGQVHTTIYDLVKHQEQVPEIA